MVYFTGTVAAKDLFTTILNKVIQVQAGQSEAWWKKESSLDSDGVYTSKGSTGAERIVLVLRPGNIGQLITTGFARDYTPGAINTAGAFDTFEAQDVYYFTSVQDQNTQITYDLNITPDRIIIHVQGDKLISGWRNSVIFLGMPLRYDINDKKCVIKSTSENSNVGNICRMLEDSIGQTLQNYTWYSVQSPGNPSWGNNFFVETLHIGNGVEGLRGELDGLYGSNPNGLVDGDVIDVTGVKFKVIKRVAVGSNAFPRDCLLLKQS